MNPSKALHQLETDLIIQAVVRQAPTNPPCIVGMAPRPKYWALCNIGGQGFEQASHSQLPYPRPFAPRPALKNIPGVVDRTIRTPNARPCIHLLPAVSPTSGGEHLAQAPKQKHLHARTAQLPGHTSNLRAVGQYAGTHLSCTAALVRLPAPIGKPPSHENPLDLSPNVSIMFAIAQKTSCSSPWVSHFRG